VREKTKKEKRNMKDIQMVIKEHERWYLGRGGKRAMLQGADLCGVDLPEAMLSGAIMEGANLTGATLRGAYLRDTNLTAANLRDTTLPGANLSGASLKGADLSGAYLRGANLEGAVLNGANLAGANLHGANLYKADASGANFIGAYLSQANLQEADLRKADLRGARYSIAVTLQAHWYDLSDELCLELMRHDCESLPDPSTMDDWAEGGPCPFGNYVRCFHFQEKCGLWRPGRPTLRGWKLWEALAYSAQIKF